MANDVQTPTGSTIQRYKMSGLLTRVWTTSVRGARSVLKSLQFARMMSVLANMSDHQLAQIGISRSEIPEYAEKLMANE